MGRGHSASGLLASAAVTAAAPLAGVHLSGWGVAAFTIAVAGASLIPDSDHPEGTIAFAFPPISKPFCEMVHRIFHGHRHGTHTLLFAPAVGLLTWLLLAIARPLHIDHHAVEPWIAGIMLYALAALGLRALHLAHAGAHPLGVAIAVAAVHLDHGLAAWLPTAVTVGCLTHVAGDCLTVEGCPALWPLRPMHEHVRVPLLGHAGSTREAWMTPLMTIGAIVLLAVGW